MGALYNCGPQPASNGRQRRSLTRKSQVLSMAKALSRLIPNTNCRLSLVIRHRQVPRALSQAGRFCCGREPRPIGPRMGALYDDGKFIIETELITSFLVLIRAPHAPDGLDAICVFLSGRPRLCQLFEVRPALPLRIRGKHADVPRFPCGSCPGHRLRQRVRAIAVPFARSGRGMR